MATKMNFLKVQNETDATTLLNGGSVTVNGVERTMKDNDILLVPDESENIDLSNYVTLDGNQTISGNKTFSSNVQFGNNVTDATTPPVTVESPYGHIALGEVDLDSYATKLTFYERGTTTNYFGRYIKYPYENFRLILPEAEFNQTHTIATQEWVQNLIEESILGGEW